MRIVNAEVATWSPIGKSDYVTSDGLHIPARAVEAVCKFNSIPATLVAVDKKHDTETAKTVLSKALTVAPQFIVDDEGKVLNALNPKSKFVTNDEYTEIIGVARELGYTEHETKESGATLRTTFKLPLSEKSSIFNDDLFEKRVILERMQEGGLFLNIELLRKVCTNGQLVADAQFKKVFHKVVSSPDLLATFFEDANNFNVKSYFEGLWNKDGKPVIASVADFFGMKKTLQQATCDEVADLIYPQDVIVDFYLNQGIAVEELPRTMQAKLPSGLTYYDAFNFLTNGIKMAEEKSLATELEVAAWAKPSKLSQLKQSDLVFQGAPYFSLDKIKRLRGDE